MSYLCFFVSNSSWLKMLTMVPTAGFPLLSAATGLRLTRQLASFTQPNRWIERSRLNTSWPCGLLTGEGMLLRFVTDCYSWLATTVTSTEICVLVSFYHILVLSPTGTVRLLSYSIIFCFIRSLVVCVTTQTNVTKSRNMKLTNPVLLLYNTLQEQKITANSVVMRQ